MQENQAADSQGGGGGSKNSNTDQNQQQENSQNLNYDHKQAGTQTQESKITRSVHKDKTGPSILQKLAEKFHKHIGLIPFPTKIAVLTGLTFCLEKANLVDPSFFEKHIKFSVENFKSGRYYTALATVLVPGSLTHLVNYIAHLQLAAQVTHSTQRLSPQEKQKLVLTRDLTSFFKNVGLFASGYLASYFLKRRLCGYSEATADTDLLMYSGVGACHCMIAYTCFKHFVRLKLGKYYVPGALFPIGAFIVGGLWNLKKFLRLDIEEFLGSASWKLYVGNMAGVGLGLVLNILVYSWVEVFKGGNADELI